LKKPRSLWASAWPLLAGLAAWEALSRAEFLPPLLFPPPTAVLRVLAQRLIHGRLLADLVRTTVLLAAGTGLGSVAGVAAAIACARWKSLGALLEPWIDATSSLPKIATVPLLVFLLGSGAPLILAVLALGMFYSMFISVRGGLLRVRRSLVETARSMGAGDLQLLREVLAPSLVPHLLIGGHLGLLDSLRQVVVIEAMFAASGLGRALFAAGEWLRMEDYYAALFLLCALGLASVRLLRRGAEVLAPWTHPSFDGD
jgi:ABC-type nitrate/sulfonate/bicarbonate transport system permease component